MDGPIAKCFGTFVVRYIKYVPVDLYENPITPGPPNLTISPHRFQAENDAYPKILDRLQRIPSYTKFENSGIRSQNGIIRELASIM